MREVYEYSESDDFDSFLGLALRNIVNYWQDQNENYNILG
tara:strand:- start:1422 stop:1541 length:120 start_codon:yes stop_codon:yes gene_type:complete